MLTKERSGSQCHGWASDTRDVRYADTTFAVFRRTRLRVRVSQHVE
jgi:hypothetical protein